MSIVLSARNNTRLLIETAVELRRNAKRLVRDAKVSARELNRLRRLSRHQLDTYNRKSGQSGQTFSDVVSHASERSS
jgi:hypothetical protein